MLFAQWLNRLSDRVLRKHKSKFAGQARRVSRRATVQASELLESRVVPTITTNITAGGVLTVTADAGVDSHVTISYDGVNNEYVINGNGEAMVDASATDTNSDANANTLNIPAAGISSISVDLGDNLSAAGDTLQGSDAGEQYTQSSMTVGAVVATFTHVEALKGGIGNDTFTIDVKFNGAIDGNSGSDTLKGALINNVKLTATGSTDGFAGTESDVTAGFGNIDVINGTGGTLTGLDADSVWTVASPATYTSGNSLTVDGFKTLQGGSAADTFNVTGVTAFNMKGGDGADTFNLDAPVNGSINGEAGADTLQGSEIDNVTLTGSGATGISGNENSLTGGFAGIDALIGNGGTLTGISVNSVWTLDGANPQYATAAAPGSPLAIVGFTTLQGGSGVDIFNVTGDSAFDLNGGLGKDKINILGATLTGVANGGGGDDTLDGQTSTAAVNLVGGDGNDVVIGSAQDDNLDGGAGNDRLYGLAGDDTMTGGLGNDSFVGGAGTDRLVEAITGSAVLTNAKMTGSNGTDTLSQMEQVELTGNDGNNSLDASAYTLGAVTLNGGKGNDTLAGGAIFGDVLDGGDDIDLVKANVAGTVTLTDTALTSSGIIDSLTGIELASLTGSAAADDINASAFTGSVSVTGGAGNDVIIGAVGASLLNGNNGNDTITGQANNDSILGGAGNDSLDGGDGADRVNGQDGQDTVNGGTGNDTLTGDGGVDVINGGDGDDSILGGAGNDTLSGDGGNDTVTGDDGNDSINGGNGADLLNGNAGNDRIVGGADDDSIYGGGGNDVLIGDNEDGTGDGNDLIDGGAGNDTIIGGGGDDNLNGEQGNDLIFGGNGNDTLAGSDGNDTLLGDDGDDSILGGTGNDLCLGGLGGDDTINGGTGKDTVGGGGDQDVIYDSNKERIDNATHDAFYVQYNAGAYLVP